MQASSMEEQGKINYNLPPGEPVNVVHPSPISLQYPVPAYPVVPQDVSIQPAVVPAVIPAKPSNPPECLGKLVKMLISCPFVFPSNFP